MKIRVTALAADWAAPDGALWYEQVRELLDRCKKEHVGEKAHEGTRCFLQKVAIRLDEITDRLTLVSYGNPSEWIEIDLDPSDPVDREVARKLLVGFDPNCGVYGIEKEYHRAVRSSERVGRKLLEVLAKEGEDDG